MYIISFMPVTPYAVLWLKTQVAVHLKPSEEVLDSYTVVRSWIIGVWQHPGPRGSYASIKVYCLDIKLESNRLILASCSLQLQGDYNMTPDRHLG